jgi:hypothetical protein
LGGIVVINAVLEVGLAKIGACSEALRVPGHMFSARRIAPSDEA